MLEVSLLLYENDKVVREQKVNLENLKLKEMQTIKLDEPYTVRDDVELTVAAKFVHGTNLTFVGIMDRVPVLRARVTYIRMMERIGKTW